MSYFKPGGLPHVPFRPLGYAVLLLLLIIACILRDETVFCSSGYHPRVSWSLGLA